LVAETLESELHAVSQAISKTESGVNQPKELAHWTPGDANNINGRKTSHFCIQRIVIEVSGIVKAKEV
jgi:hypothetical protein